MNEGTRTQDFCIKISLLMALTILFVVPVFIFTASYSHAAQNIVDGDLVTVFPNPDIYIVKVTGVKKFKRLILNPDIFNSYGHLKWSSVKTIDQTTLDLYKLSELVIEINSDGSVADPKVYRVASSANSDIGERSWLNLTASEFEAAGYDWDSLFHVNHKEALPDFYPTKNPLTFQNILQERQTIEQKVAPTITTQVGVAGSLALSTNPTALLADGKSSSIVTAIVRDTSGNLMPNQVVRFVYGSVAIAAVTGLDGAAKTTYTADTSTGTADITASTGNVQNTTRIEKTVNATAGSLTIAAGLGMPPAQIRTYGEKDQTLAVFSFTAGSGENISITRIVITDLVSGSISEDECTPCAFANFKLLKLDGTQIGQTDYSVERVTSSKGIATFDPITNFTIEKGKTELVTLKGDVVGYSASGSNHAFGIESNSDVATVGISLKNAVPLIGAPVMGKEQTVYRAKLTASNTMSNTGGIAGANQQVGKYTLTNAIPTSYSINVSDIDLAISSTIAVSTTATRYVTLRKESPSGTIIARKGFRGSFTDVTNWTATTGDINEISFASTENLGIDSPVYGNYVNIYVMVDAEDAISGNTLSTSISSITWTDGLTSNITVLDNIPIVGSRVSY